MTQSRGSASPRMIAALGVLAVAAMLAVGTRAGAQDRPAEPEAPWTVAKDFTSPIDGKRTLTVQTRRGEVGIAVGCQLGRPEAVFTFERSTLRSRTRAAGAYRIEGRGPVYLTWEGVDSLVWKLEGEPAATLISGLFAATVLHIRIDDLERSLPVAGLQTYRERLAAACLATG